VQGFRTIMVTEGVHPYMSAWWPAGHIIGWEHTFIHEVRDTLIAIHKKQPVYPDSLTVSAASRCWRR